MQVASQVKRIIEIGRDLPPFPELAQRVLEVAQDPLADAKDICEVVQYDQAITANCLKVCNSSFFGLRQNISSLQHAVVLLGTRFLVETVLAVSSAFSEFGEAQQGYGFHPGQLWRHSVTCAITSQLLIKKLGRDQDYKLFTASLLHDVGKAIDPQEHVAAGLSALEGFITERTAWFIEHHMSGQLVLDGTIGARARRRLQRSENYEELLTLCRCDRDGRQIGVEAPELDEALDYIRNLSETFGQ